MQAIRDLCTKYSVKEPSGLVDAQVINEDGLFAMRRVVELTEELDSTRESGLTQAKEYEIDVDRLYGLVSQHMLLQEKAANTFLHA